MPRCLLKVVNEKGLHARPAARIVKCVQGYDADISLKFGTDIVAATSIMGLLMFGAPQGAEIEGHAHGRDADVALRALTALFESGFGES